MRRLMAGVMLACTVLSVKAADDSVFGTHWVRSQPVQVGGQLEGCSLVYLAVQADRVYLNGDQVAINGSLVLRSAQGNSLGLMLKIGLKNMTKGSPLERPNFAYIQTASGTSASAKQQILDGDEGYRLFIYNAKDPAIFKMIEDLTNNSKVSIGYNRKKDGMDVIVPLDLTVVDSEYTADQRVIRKNSPESILGFSDCVVKLMDDVLGKFGKK